MGGFTPDQWQQEWVTHLNQAWLNPPSNRLTHLESRRSGVANPPIVAQTHFFDDNGNLIRENNARHFEWDYADRMRVFRTQTGNAEPTVHAHYLYDASGQRVKKLVRKQGGQVEVTVYIDGVFEYQRIVQGGVTRENNTMHVMDNQSRIALVRVGNPFPDDTTPAVKYHLGDHLGSSSVVVDEVGNWVNREEYTPYGETSFGSFSRKRYRFTGKERDEESGLNCHGARCYAPWLIRWTNCDPAGPVDGPNLYAYTKNPLSFTDPQGTEPQSVTCTTITTKSSSMPSEAGTPVIHDESTLTICKPPSVSQPSASASQSGSARPADEPDTPGQMPHSSTSVPETPTTAAIGQSEVPSASSIPEASNEPSVARAAGGFAQGVWEGLLPGGFLFGSSHPESQTYEIARGIGQIVGGIGANILGHMIMAHGAAEFVGGAIAAAPSGGASLVLSGVGSVEVAAGAVVVVGGTLNIVAGISTIGNAMSMGGGGKDKEYFEEKYGDQGDGDSKLFRTKGGTERVKLTGQQLKMLNDAAKEAGISDAGRGPFTDYVHGAKRAHDLGSKGSGDRTYPELLDLAKQFLDEFPQYRR